MIDPAASPRIEIPSRAPSATTADDTVMPFEVATLDLRGRVVRFPEHGADGRRLLVPHIGWNEVRWTRPGPDAARVAHLIELAIEFAHHHMKPEGALVAKLFHGSGYSELTKLFKNNFRIVKPIKPKASRDKSSETFMVGIGLKATDTN